LLLLEIWFIKEEVLSSILELWCIYAFMWTHSHHIWWRLLLHLLLLIIILWSCWL